MNQILAQRTEKFQHGSRIPSLQAQISPCRQNLKVKPWILNSTLGFTQTGLFSTQFFNSILKLALLAKTSNEPAQAWNQPLLALDEPSLA